MCLFLDLVCLSKETLRPSVFLSTLLFTHDLCVKFAIIWQTELEARVWRNNDVMHGKSDMTKHSLQRDTVSSYLCFIKKKYHRNI